MVQNLIKNQSKNQSNFQLIFYRFLLHFDLQLGGPRGSNEPPFWSLCWLLRPTWANLANLGQLGPTWGSFAANLDQLGPNLRPTWGQLKPTWAAFDFNLVPEIPTGTPVGRRAENAC